MIFLKRRWLSLILLFLLAVGFYFRINGLDKNYSFWTDEASTARFARGILENGIPKITLTGYKENSYYVTHYLTALSFRLWGQNELAARLPEVFLGTLLILIIYCVGRKVFNDYVGFGAALLTTVSYIQIAWSRQARGYVILEVFFLFSLYFLYKIKTSSKPINYLLLSLFLLLSIWTHTLGFILIPISLTYLVVSGIAKNILKTRWILLGLVLLILVLILFTNLQSALNFIWSKTIPRVIKGENFLFYYHSLFWRQYSLISFLSFLGFLLLWLKGKKETFWLFGVPLFVYFFTAIFLLPVPFEKYILPIFPLFYLLASSGLYEIAALFSKNYFRRLLAFFLLLVFILVNGNKFSLTPRSFYSLNFDMREIPEIDYKGIYEIVRNRLAAEDLDKVPIVDISSDLPAWYLGEGKLLFIPRKDVPRKTLVNENTGAFYLHDLEEFVEIYSRCPKGFVVLIEHNFRFYPEGFVDYVRKNLRLEKREEVAWFSPDWNHWPIELYSWDNGNIGD